MKKLFLPTSSFRFQWFYTLAAVRAGNGMGGVSIVFDARAGT